MKYYIVLNHVIKTLCGAWRGVRTSDEGTRQLVIPGTAPEPSQRLLERLTEVRPEVGVDERVEGRVEVSDPEESCDDSLGTRAAIATYGNGHVPSEEGQPTQDEGAHDDAQCPRRLVFSSHHRVAAVVRVPPATPKTRWCQGFTPTKGHGAYDPDW